VKLRIDIDSLTDRGLGSVVDQLNRWRSKLVEHGRQFGQLPFLDGVWIREQEFLATTDTPVNHKLGRTPRGWFVTSMQTNAGSLKLVEWDNRTATLYASVAMTVDIWFF
jgi:hypothetical protein